MSGDAAHGEIHHAPEGVERRLPIRRVSPDDPDRRAKVSPQIERLAWWLDESIAVPGTSRRVGLDGVIGLIPGVGDLAGLVAGLVVVGAGILGGVAVPTVLRMLWNLTIAATVGLIPFLGDAFDFVFKASTRNVRLINADLADRSGTARRSVAVLIGWIIGTVVFVFFAIAAVIALIVWAFRTVG